jgi:DNA-binding transcriptional ArsR family regulator
LTAFEVFFYNMNRLAYTQQLNMASKELIFKIKADFLKSIASPVRLAVIEHLKQGESSVGDLGKALSVEQSSLSKHLAILRQAGILSARQEKVTVYYSIKDKDIFKVLKPISDMLRKNLQESQIALAHLGRK